MPYADPEVRRIARRKSYLHRKEMILSKERFYRSNNPESKRQIQYKRRYGITIEQFDHMVASQNGCCAICQEKFKPAKNKMSIHVDHCHATGVVRGILCARCNVGLGLFKDNIDQLLKAINYLKRNLT